MKVNIHALLWPSNMIIDGKLSKIIYKAHSSIHSPQQRFIIGATALVTQPIIDLKNKKTDEDTRILSACRSLGKIIAATTSGVIVREACIKVADKFITKDVMQKFISDPKLLQDFKIRKFNNFMGSVGALGVMLFTNFLWDAPVTQKLTNFFYNHVSNKKETK